MAGTLESVTIALLTLVSFVLAAVALRSWRHAQSPRLALVACGFGLFLVKGLVLTAGLFGVGTWPGPYLMVSAVIDLAILALFYAAILKRTPR